MKKKKRDRWLLLLIILAVLAYFASTFGGVFGGTPSPGPGNSSPDGCCCADDFAYVFQAPGGECKCITCPDQQNLLIKNGTFCCTTNQCEQWAVL